MRGNRRNESVIARVGRAIWNGKFAVLVALLATMVPAIALTLSNNQPYRAEAHMIIRQFPSDVADQNDSIDPQRRLLNEIAVLEGGEVAQRVRADLEIAGDVPEVHGSLGTATDVIVARVDSPSAQIAASLADAYIQAYIAVQSASLTQSYTAAIGQIEGQVAQLDSQIAALADDDPQRTALAQERDRSIDTLQLLTVDLAVARAPAEVVRSAEIPTDTRDASLRRAVLLSLAVGLVLSAIGVMLLNSGGDKLVRTAADLRNLRGTEPVLAVVPADRAGQQPLSQRQPPAGRVLDAYDTLRTAVQRLVIQRDAHVIQVCSPNDGDGATTTAVYLAVMLSQAGASVALVDLDLRNPRVHTMLDLDQSPGVTDALDEDRDDTDGIRALSRLDILDRDPSGSIARPSFDDVERAVQAGESSALGPLVLEPLVLDPAPVFLPIAYYDDLTVITAGTPPRSALETLSRRRMDELIDDLRQRYDIVIIDSPSVATGGDAVAIARQADGAIMVVKPGTITLPALRQALGSVDRGGARILGVVLNGT